VSSQTISIINNATQIKSKYNILTFDTHERYQTQLAKTGHSFYSFQQKGGKKWNETFAKKPTNYYSLPENTIINGIDFDFILSQSKFGQFQITQQINNVLRLPIVSLEHTLPVANWPKSQLDSFSGMQGDFNVFISEFSAKAWQVPGHNDIIHHSVDTNVFSPDTTGKEKSPTVLSVVNGFAERDYCCNYSGWQRISNGLNTRLVGDNPGLSEAAKTIEDLVHEYQSCHVFLNTSTLSPIPTSLLEAMSCGCAVVSTATCMIPEIIQNGVNGFISNDESELRGYINTLLADEDLRKKMGACARNTILTKFSEQEFINNWNNIFNQAYGAKK